MSAFSRLLPEHEGLRHAVAWLLEQGRWTPELVDEASRRFDLSPVDEEFLLNEAVRMADAGRLPPWQR